MDIQEECQEYLENNKDKLMTRLKLLENRTYEDFVKGEITRIKGEISIIDALITICG